jgi:hypothetical protein
VKEGRRAEIVARRGFGEELRDQAGTAGTTAGRMQFALALGAREEKIGEIDASDEKNEGHGGEGTKVRCEDFDDVSWVGTRRRDQPAAAGYSSGNCRAS